MFLEQKNGKLSLKHFNKEVKDISLQINYLSYQLKTLV